MKELIVLLVMLIIFSGCGNNFDMKKNVTGRQVNFINQDSAEVNYPGIIKGKVAVIGFIYTNCPDICPMTTHNMQLAEEKLSKDQLNDVKFLLITFDPDRDTPSILTKFASVREMNMDDWELLTGSTKNINTILDEFNVKAIHDDTTYNDNGRPDYFIIHTDRISLVDENGNLRKNYHGSTANPDELAEDIKSLL